MLSTSAEAARAISSTSCERVRHHRQRAERERRVGGLVHDDVVRDLVDERLALADQRRGRRRRSRRPSQARTSTGPSPAPISGDPCATAREAASAAPRAACSRDSPRASSAASVAECVQPAPWVAAHVVALDRDLEVPLAVEEVVDRIAVAAGHDRRRRAELDEPLGELALRPVADEQPRPRPGSASPRPRAGRAARPALRRRRPAAAARPSSRPSPGRPRAAPGARRGSPRPSRSRSPRRASPSWPRRRRCRRRPPRAAPVRTPAAARARRSRRPCSARSARRSRSCRSSRRRRRPSGRPGSPRRHPSRSPRSSDISEPNCTPFAGTNRIRFDGCDLSP